MPHIVGMFDQRDHAETAILRLRALGVSSDAISFAMKHDDAPTLAASTGAHDLAEEGTAVGAISGAAVGTLVGLLVAGSTFALPGIGTFLVAGPLAAALTGAGVGAASGGVLGALVGSGIPEADASHYLTGIGEGRVFVSANVDAPHADHVRRVFAEEGARNTHDV